MSPLPLTRLLAYGGLGLPLAFAALPLYVHLAPFYSGVISLSLLGAILLGAVSGPEIGRASCRERV